jgi:thiamine-monophosphate kinase
MVNRRNPYPMKRLIENQILTKIAGKFPRSPDQRNALLESDAELLQMENGLLAITTDSLVEEIEEGLYKDPWLIGWMTVVASLSDLAATGAQPLGLLLSQNLPQSLTSDSLDQLQEGIREACRACHTFILGGDTNTSPTLQMGATAVGWIPDQKSILRKGCQEDDHLYCSGHLGSGNAFAFAELLQKGRKNPISYRPFPRLRKGILVRKYGSACIDTSDGFFPALANLMTINESGFRLLKSWPEMLGTELTEFALSSGLPPWFFLAGPHGEFELLFCISPEQEEAFLKEASLIHWKPLLLGKVISEKTCLMKQDEEKYRIDPIEIANLYPRSQGDLQKYIHLLQKHQLS